MQQIARLNVAPIAGHSGTAFLFRCGVLLLVGAEVGPVMPRVCTICCHSKRLAINRQLVGGVPLRDIAEQYDVSSSSLDRHKSGHLPASMLRAKTAREVLDADRLVGELLELREAAEDVLEQARESKDGELQLRAIARLEKLLELIARLVGELRNSPAINVTLSPEWHALRASIVAALRAHPDALASVLAALRGIAGASSTSTTIEIESDAA